MTAVAVAVLAAVAETQGQEPVPVPPTFRAGTVLVQVSAVVTAGGKPITDLRRDEVQILDNGVPQDLVAFEYIDLRVIAVLHGARDLGPILSTRE